MAKEPLCYFTAETSHLLSKFFLGSEGGIGGITQHDLPSPILVRNRQRRKEGRDKVVQMKGNILRKVPVILPV